MYETFYLEIRQVWSDDIKMPDDHNLRASAKADMLIDHYGLDVKTIHISASLHLNFVKINKKRDFYVFSLSDHPCLWTSRG